MTQLCRFCALLSLLVFSKSAFSQASDSTLIDVQLEGLQAGKIRVVGTFGDQNYIADSTVADATGRFELRRKSLLAPGFYTFLLPGMKNFSILIDKDQRMTVRGNVNDPNNFQIEGSLNTALFYQNARFQAAQEPEFQRLGAILKKSAPGSPEQAEAKQRQAQLLAERKASLETIYREHPQALFTKFKIAGQNPDIQDFRKPNGDLDTLKQLLTFRGQFWDGVDFTDERLLHTPVVINKLRKYIKELTPQQPDSIIKVADELIRRVRPHREYFKFFANWIGLEYENGKTTVMDGEAVYVHIIKNFMTPELAFWSNPKEIQDLQKHVSEMEASLLGRKGPDVRAQDIYGNFKSIYEMTAPLVVVFMFSPDCEHCQKEAPEIQRLYEKWKPRGVDFYGIGVKTSSEEWKAFIQKSGFTFTNVFDPTNRAIYAKYYVDITPELYVLDKDRTIVAKNLKAEQLEEVFERQFRKMKK